MLTVIAGLAVFLVVLVLYLPASWFASLLPAQVRCARTRWLALARRMPGTRRSRARSSAMPPGIWRRQRARGPAGGRRRRAWRRAQCARRPRYSSSTASANCAMSRRAFRSTPPSSPQFPRDQRGNIVADLKRVVLGAGSCAARNCEGTVELHDLRQVGAQPAGARLLSRDLRWRDPGGWHFGRQAARYRRPVCRRGHADADAAQWLPGAGLHHRAQRRRRTPGARNHARRATRCLGPQRVLASKATY